MNDPTKTSPPGDALLRRFFDLSPDIFLILGLDGKSRQINPAGQAILGYTEEEFLAVPYLDLVHEPDRHLAKEAIAELARGNPVHLAEFRNIRKDGGLVWIAWSGVPSSEDGLFYAVGRDITRVKQDEKKLSNALSRVAALSGSPAVIYCGNLVMEGGRQRFRQTFVTENLARMFGWSPEECLVDPDWWEKGMHPENRAIRKGWEGRLLERGRLSAEYRFRTKGGQYRWVRDEVALEAEANGGPAQVLGCWLDITLRKTAEIALLESEKNLREAQKIARMGHWKFNILDHSFHWCEEIYRICGLQPENPLPDFTAFIQTILPEDRERVGEAIMEALESRGQYDIEHRVIRPGGEVRIVRHSGAVFSGENSEPTHLSGTLQDITRLKRGEQEKAQLEKALIEARKTQTLGTLAGGIAHHFNNILGVIIGNSELASYDLPAWSPAKKCLEEVIRAGLRGRDIVRQLVSITHERDEEKVPAELTRLVRDSVRFLSETLPERIRLDLSLDCGDCYVRANSTQIYETMANLIRNSVQAIGNNPGEIRVRLFMTPPAEEDLLACPGLNGQDYAVLCVSDSGPGMTREILERIFDPYFTTRGLGDSSGMGLSVVRSIVAAHQGDIRVKTAPGLGAEFCIWLPLLSDTPQKDSQETKPPIMGQSILFVDDEPAVVELAKRVLSREGHRVRACGSPIRALELFRAGPGEFDLVVTDWAMPEMTGGELAGEIRKINPEFPVLYCLGSREVENVQMKSGKTGVLCKPFLSHELLRAVSDVLEG